jgi:hypothetical protein
VVQLLYRKGDKTSMTNYSSISLLTASSQVLQKAVHGRLSQHLHINNMQVTEEYGFGKGVSTDDAAFRLTDTVFRSVKHKMRVEEIFCDLA